MSFAAGGGRTLDVRNINGFIHVEATNDSTVQMSIRKVIRAATRDDLAEAQRDVRLDFAEGAPRVGATVDRPERPRLRRASGTIGDRGGTACTTSVRFDFTIRVPRDVALRLCTINGGDVIVNGTQGDFDRRQRQRPGRDEPGRRLRPRAHRQRRRSRSASPPTRRQPSSFKTVNGNVDVSFLDGLAADFAMKTMNGGLFTDFDAQPMASPAAAAGERRNGKFVYRANEFTRVRVGSGGPEITFETLNGNVRARRAGGQP